MKKYTLILFGFILVFVLGLTTTVSAQTTSGFTYSGVLRSGMSGPVVSTLQSTLNSVNVGVLSISTDGKFGPATRGAVQHFQSLHGLPADGVVGPITGAALNNAVSLLVVYPTTGPLCPNGMTLESNCRINPVPNPCPLTVVNGEVIHVCPTPMPIPLPNSQVVISGVSGPQSLSVNQQGNWTVTASSPNGGNLSYSVIWGDETFAQNSFATPSVRFPQQSATFTHSYTQAGIYTPTFTVTSENTIRCIQAPCPSNAGSAQTSISVNVGRVTSVQIPSISSLSPTSGDIGTQVTIFGSGLSGANVNFGGFFVPASFTSVNQLTFTVPTNLSNCMPGILCTMMFRPIGSGTYSVYVVNQNSISNSLNFTVTGGLFQ